MILLAYFSCDYVCCHVMQINYCAPATDPADVVGWLVVECIFATAARIELLLGTEAGCTQCFTVLWAVLGKLLFKSN